MSPQPPKDQGKPADYLAVERTFHTWVHTATIIIALGFVVVNHGDVSRG